jgi:hypothetical protein
MEIMIDSTSCQASSGAEKKRPPSRFASLAVD